LGRPARTRVRDTGRPSNTARERAVRRICPPPSPWLPSRVNTDAPAEETMTAVRTVDSPDHDDRTAGLQRKPCQFERDRAPAGRCVPSWSLLARDAPERGATPGDRTMRPVCLVRAPVNPAPHLAQMARGASAQLDAGQPWAGTRDVAAWGGAARVGRQRDTGTVPLAEWPAGSRSSSSACRLRGVQGPAASGRRLRRFGNAASQASDQA
jgi:hypothetical protein